MTQEASLDHEIDQDQEAGHQIEKTEAGLEVDQDLDRDQLRSNRKNSVKTEKNTDFDDDL